MDPTTYYAAADITRQGMEIREGIRQGKVTREELLEWQTTFKMVLREYTRRKCHQSPLFGFMKEQLRTTLAMIDQHLRPAVRRDDKDMRKAVLDVLEQAGDLETIAAFQKYMELGTMDKAAAKLGVSKSKVQRLLKSAEKKSGARIIRKPGGGAHTGDTYKHQGRTRNSTHRPPET